MRGGIGGSGKEWGWKVGGECGKKVGGQRLGGVVNGMDND